MKPKISIIMPAYNEERRITKALHKVTEYFDSKKKNYEFIVVDDGSKDKTSQIVTDFIRKYKRKNMKLLVNKPNRGKGYSVKRGMLEAEGELLLFTDTDLSTPIEEYEKLKFYIEKGYHIVIASRGAKDSNLEVPPSFFRHLLGFSFGIIKTLAGLKRINDSQCGFKLFRNKVAKFIFSKQTIERFAFDVEILYIAQKYKCKIKEVGVTWINSTDSKVNPIKDGINMFKEILKIRLNDINGRYKT